MVVSKPDGALVILFSNLTDERLSTSLVGCADCRECYISAFPEAKAGVGLGEGEQQ